jgi:acyl transferase domain-containing protein/acyl carrier protein
MSVYDPHSTPLAIVGVSAIFPGSIDKTGFWRDILAGRDLITDVPETHWLQQDYYDPDPSAPDKTYSHRGAFLSPVPFDPLEWGVPPSIVPATDTTQLLALIVAKQVLEDASNGKFQELDKSRISCILGVTGAQELLGTMVNRLQQPVWASSLRELGYAEDEVTEICARIASKYVPWQESSFPGLLGNVVAGRIANRLDLGGTNCVTDAACASSFSAVSMAANELWLGQSDLVIAGGADTMNDIFMYMCFSKTPALSMSGDCRPFSDQSDGTLLGEGLGMFAIKRLVDAEKNNDHVYAVLKGLGASSDGRSKSVYAPVAAGQEKALHRAYAQAGYTPDTVELVEAHGTGTKAGDVAEFEGLRTAFDTYGRKDRQWCAIGTVKSQIGHTKAAAGAAGLFKAVMALHHKVLPPTIKVDRPNPRLEIEKSPFYLNTHTRPWIRGPEHPRRASVSSFGFGGSNFHLTLEEYDGPAPRAPRLHTAPTELVVLSAADGPALASLARSWAARSTIDGFLRFAARHTQEQFDAALPARLAVVAADEAELAQKLTQAADRLDSHPNEALHLPTGLSVAVGETPGKVAFLFPGQGSQAVEMTGELSVAVPAARAAWDRVAGVLPDLAGVVFPRPVFEKGVEKKLDEKLRATEWAQPATGAASLAVLGVLDQLGVKPDAVAGHSYGEVTALHVAGVLSEADMLRVARRRGELMAEAARTPGAMLAVPKGIDEVKAALAGHDRVVVANHNAPEQVVVSGPTDAVEAFAAKLTAAGIEGKRLPVATAFHSPVVADAAGAFGTFLADVTFDRPKIPVWHNATADQHPKTPAKIRSALATAIASPVRFVEQIRSMADAGVTTFVEVGPGSVLTGLTGEILAGRPHVAVALDRRKKHGATALQLGLGRLAVAGVPLKLATLWEGVEALPDPHERKQPKLAIHIDGSNHGKPYPPKGGAAALPKKNPTRIGYARSKDPEPKVIEKVVERRVEVPTPVAAPASAPIAAPRHGAPMSQPPRPTETAAVDPWIVAFQEAQRATVDAHTAYQRAMADSHQQFLRTLGQSFDGLARMAGAPWQDLDSSAGRAEGVQPIVARTAMPAMAVHTPTFAPPVHLSPPPELTFARSVAKTDPASLVQSGADLVRAVTADASAARARSIATATAPPADLERLLLEVVADKTGYPADMLGMHMQLEADLGVDSIKRVEILSAVRERAPGLPEVDAAQMAQLQTLGQVVDHLRSYSPPATSAPAAAPSLAPARAPAPASTGAPDIERLLLEVVADKTGYPADMLGMHMALEADLGVDSIKRVEILSAVRERAPGLPEVDAQQMAQLQTLGQVVDHLRAVGGPAPSPSIAAAPAPASAPMGALDIERLLLEVVADKTGYPADMLGMHMALEADLGVDSIKRVEILSAVRERAPSLPEVDAAEMAKLQTLGQVVEHLRSSLGGQPSAVAAILEAPPEEDPSPEPADPRLGRWVTRPADAPAWGLSQPGFGPNARVVITPPGAVASALHAALAGRGQPSTLAEAVPADADVVVFLGGLDAADPRAMHRAAFEAAKVVAPRMTANGGLFVTVQDTGGSLTGDAYPWNGGLTGLVKTLAQEWPKASVKAIDIAVAGRSPEGVADALVAELWAGGPEVEVGLAADGRRTTLCSTPAPVTPGAPAISRDSVVVATGGGRGVTAACLVALARAHGGHYALLGRSAIEEESAATAGIEDDAALKKALLAQAGTKRPTPAELGKQVARLRASREVRATLDAIRAAGAEVSYVVADVNDRAGLARTLDEVRKTWGPITALVHGAGVLADKLVSDKTVEQWVAVFDTKAGSLGTLLEATREDPLAAVALFSSVAGRCGNRGQADYAAANEVLAKVGRRLALDRPGCVVKALQWGPWKGGMVNAALERQFEALGVPLIPLATGARMFVDELSDRSGDVEIVLGGEPRMGPLAAADADRALTLRVHVDRTSHPHLADHTVAGVPVVPIALAVEWCARAAAACRPDLVLRALRDVKVLRGIKLDGFDTKGDVFDVTAREVSNGAGAELALEIRRPGGPVHYTAGASMVEVAPGAPRAAAVPRLGAWGDTPIYDGDTLFHGALFQVIRSLDGVSDDALLATLDPTEDAGWPDEPWRTDPAALDGGLQLALLWTRRVLGKASLPMGVGEVRTYAPGSGHGPLRALLRGQRSGPSRTVTDITFTDATGAVVHELRGVESILRPDA